jgi:N-acetylmuramoyl-L-alanine amidase
MLPLALLLLAQTKANLTVCIDPGHPSEVGEGTSGAKVSEIHIAWVVAKRLETILEGKHVKVVLTKKSENEYVKNVDRSKIANDCHADLFVRLHCDSSSGSGFATYYPDRQGTAHGKTGPDPSLLKRLAPIARQFQATLSTDLKGFLKSNGLKSDIETAVGSKQGALTGSIFSKVPVVLVEMCVLTNPKDEAKVSSQDGQNRLAESLADAVMKALGR